MASNTSIETLFREHSLEEIESIRDNLAIEIEKRTELLKSIVKEKYRDVVETSDAIQSMKLTLKEVDQSLWSLDKCISEFYVKLKEPTIEPPSRVTQTHSASLTETDGGASEKQVDVASDIETHQDIVKKFLSNSAEFWENFDSGNLKSSVKVLKDMTHLLETNRNELSQTHPAIVDNLQLTLDRTRDMIKNSLWHMIQGAAPDQIGIIAGSDQKDLYELSLNSAIKFLVDEAREELSDTGFHAQMRRYQPHSYFNPQTNELEPPNDSPNAISSGRIQIPKFISPELSKFLYEVCKVVNTIAGFNLSKTSIVESLHVTISCILSVYADIVSGVDELKGEIKRKRALQLYFDLLFLRILLNTSKSVELIERLDPRINDMANKYESMMDSIELYMISAALHSNVINLSKSTIRLYGLLIPHLQ